MEGRATSPAAEETQGRAELVRRALALNRLMRDEAQTALRQIDEALKAVNRRVKEARLEAKRAQVDADDAAFRSARTRRRPRAVGESFFSAADEAVAPPEMNLDTLRVRRLLQGVPLGGASERAGAWPRQWRDELGATVAELLRGALLERSRRERYAPAAPAVTAPAAFPALAAPSAQPPSGSMVPFQSQAAAAPAAWDGSVEGASPGDCAALLERLISESARIHALMVSELVASSPPLAGSFWAGAACALAVKLGGDKATHPGAEECARQWASHPLNPAVELASAWSAEEDATLVKLARGGSLTWEEIARDHAEGRARARPLIELVKRYQRALNPRMTRHAWTKEEDSLLRAAVARHGVGNWQAVSASLPLRTNTQCMLRYLKTVDPRINRGYWSPCEDVLLEASVNVHSSELTRARTEPLAASRACKVAWVKVKLTVPNRTDAQCRERFCNVTDPLNQRGRAEWAAEDDARLSALVNSHWRPGSGCGSWRLVPWSRVAQEMAPLPVSDADCRRRFYGRLATEEQAREYDELTRLRRAVLPSNYGGRLAERPSALASSLFRLKETPQDAAETPQDAAEPAQPLPLLAPGEGLAGGLEGDGDEARALLAAAAAGGCAETAADAMVTAAGAAGGAAASKSPRAKRARAPKRSAAAAQPAPAGAAEVAEVTAAADAVGMAGDAAASKPPRAKRARAAPKRSAAAAQPAPAGAAEDAEVTAAADAVGMAGDAAASKPPRAKRARAAPKRSAAVAQPAPAAEAVEAAEVTAAADAVGAASAACAQAGAAGDAAASKPPRAKRARAGPKRGAAAAQPAPAEAAEAEVTAAADAVGAAEQAEAAEALETLRAKRSRAPRGPSATPAGSGTADDDYST